MKLTAPTTLGITRDATNHGCHGCDTPVCVRFAAPLPRVPALRVGNKKVKFTLLLYAGRNEFCSAAFTGTLPLHSFVGASLKRNLNICLTFCHL